MLFNNLFRAIFFAKMYPGNGTGVSLPDVVENQTLRKKVKRISMKFSNIILVIRPFSNVIPFCVSLCNISYVTFLCYRVDYLQIMQTFTSDRNSRGSM